MKKALFISFCYAWFSGDAFATVYNSSVDIDSFGTDEIIISENGIISANSNPILLDRQDTYIYNSGIINADLDTNDFNVFIKNSGTINGNIYITGNSSLTQIISNNSEITNLSVIGDANKFGISIDNFDRVDFTDIRNLDSNNFSFEKSSVVIESLSDWNNWIKNVSFIGNDNTIYITNSYAVQSGTLINNTDVATNIEVIIEDQDRLHKANAEKSPFGIILHIVRETDYRKIFTDNRGVLLGGLQDKNPNDKLLVAMNKANNTVELNKVMNSSYRFNHKILLRPLNVINKFSMMDIYDKSEELNVGIKPFFVGGDKVSGYGGNLYVYDKYKDVYWGLNARFNTSSYKDNINDFGLVSFGADVKAQTCIVDNYWVRAISGFNVAKYKADYIYDKASVKNNPNANSWYLTMDVGYDFDIDDNLTVSPFVGINTQRLSVLDKKDFQFDGRLGSGVKYFFAMDEIKYTYNAILGVETDGDLFGKLSVGFDALQDKAGVSLDTEIINTKDIGLNYKISINAKIEF